jgi:hypothetical protein
MPHFKSFWILAVQPISALLFLVYCVAWLLNEAFWPARPETRPSHAGS